MKAYVCSSLFGSFQVLKRLQQKDGGRPQRGGQERGDMENQEADQKFGSCPWVSTRFEMFVGSVVGGAVKECISSSNSVNADHRDSLRLDKVRPNLGVVSLALLT